MFVNICLTYVICFLTFVLSLQGGRKKKIETETVNVASL